MSWKAECDSDQGYSAVELFGQEGYPGDDELIRMEKETLVAKFCIEDTGALERERSRFRKAKGVKYCAGCAQPDGGKQPGGRIEGLYIGGQIRPWEPHPETFAC